jgi:hypothetical protein
MKTKGCNTGMLKNVDDVKCERKRKEKEKTKLVANRPII